MTTSAPAGSRVVDRGLSMARALIVGSAIDDSDLDVYEFRVYAHLKRRAGDGEVWERQEQMAAICKMSRKKLNEVLGSLEKRGWIMQENRKYKGQQASNLITLLEPPCHPQLHGQVTDSYTAVSPTVTAKGIPHQGIPQEGKKREVTASPALNRNTQKASEKADLPQPTSANAVTAHAANQAIPDPVQNDAQVQATPDGQGHDQENLSGGAAAGEPSETEKYLRRKLSHKFVDMMVEEVQPLGVNRGKDWFALPLARVQELMGEATLTHEAHKVKVPTRFKDLLDEECRRVGIGRAAPAPAALDDDGEIDMAALIASAPLNGSRRNR